MPEPTSLLAIAFLLITLGTVGWFYAASKSMVVLVVLLGWTALQSALTLTGLYQQTEMMPPWIFACGLVPTIIAMIILLTTRKGKAFVDGLNLQTLTWLHFIRVPVEIVLLLLFLEGVLPEAMTFEGTNWDVISGATAPIVAFMSFAGAKVVRARPLFWWNVACLLVLLNVVVTGVLSAPFPLQQFNFDQPATSLLHFPFSLLPTIVVPVVIFSHLVALRQLWGKS